VPGSDAGARARVIERVQSASGLLDVIDTANGVRYLLLNGVNQGGMDRSSGASSEPFSDYLSFLRYRYHPQAKRALLLGLGCGVLAKTLYGMGVEVTAVEIEPEIVRLARKYFALPTGVHVVVEDGRAFLARDDAHYDVVILDAYAGETSPWYLLTREGLAAAKARLSPGGRMLFNTVTQANGQSEGLKRLEAALVDVFGEGLVFIEPRLEIEGDAIVNATLVAGAHLHATQDPYPAVPSDRVAPYLGDLNAAHLRRARRGGVIDSDEQSGLEVVEADLRLRWRSAVIATLGAEALRD